jgi:MFS family permease
MFGFFVKKAFFDMWDNLFKIIILNLGYILVIGLAVLLPYLARYLTFLPQTPTFFVLMFLAIAAFSVYTGAVSCIARDIADYEEPGFKDFYRYLGETYKPSLIFALVNFGVFFLLSLAMPFYLSVKSLIGPLAFAFLFWLALIWIIAIQFFFPLQSRFDRSFRKNIRKVFLIFFDNTAFTVGAFIGSTLIFIASSFTAFMLPGIATIVLWLNVGLKLRVLKYDYLEENPDANRKKIPWDVLLIEDKERVGKRTLKGMIFPWKE